MAWAGRIYFISDKSGADNIWSVDETGGDPRQHTRSTAWQMRTPALYDGRILYQSGADLFAYDIASGSTSPVSLSLASDGDFKRRRWLETPLDFLEGAHLAPFGDAVTVTARGRAVTGFIGPRRRVEHRIPDGARIRSSRMVADGKWMYAVVDSGVRGEIWRFPADGAGEGAPVTSNTPSHIWDIHPAPKGNALLWQDKRGKLFHLDTSTGRSTEIETSQSTSDIGFGEFSWSDDGRYAVYTFVDARDITQVAMYDTQTRRRTVMTGGKYESFSPALSPDGAWLYFLSNRNFKPFPGAPWGDRNMGPSFRGRTKLYALQLDPSADFPFKPADELSKKKDDAGKDDDKDKAGAQASIDLRGVQDRLWEVPVGAGDYFGLATTSSHLFVQQRGASSDDPPSLKRIKITNVSPEVSDYASDVQRYELSADRSKLFVQTGERGKAKFLIVSPGEDFPKDASKNQVRIGDWRLAVDPREEWRQMALDAWRLHRDFAYDSALRGVNWDAVRDRFLPLAGRLGHRSELNDLLAQMSAELGILHSQIRPGELPRDEEGGAPTARLRGGRP